MFWILRRTGAVNFFNSLNNNCGTSKGNNNSTNDKYVKRPPRKAYGRLSAHDSDDNASIKQQQIDSPFDELDNFKMITTGKGNATNGNDGLNCTTKKTTATTTSIDANGQICTHIENRVEDKNADCVGMDNCQDASCHRNFENGNKVNGDAAELSCDMDNGCSLDKEQQKEVYQNTINRLHAMALSDDDDYDEALTCNVCDRAFAGHRQLASHQQKKRHFCCSACDSLFPSLMVLEHHKEEFEHWDDEEIHRRICCRHNRSDDFFTDTDSFTSDAESEDLERLL